MKADLAAQTEAAELGDDAALAAAESAARQAAETQRGRLAEAMQAESHSLRRHCVQRVIASNPASLKPGSGKNARPVPQRGSNRCAPAWPKPRPNSKSSCEARRDRRTAPCAADRLEEAETLRQQAADALRLAETALAEAETAQRQADASLAEGREAQIQAEGARERAEETRRVLLAQIEEKLGCGPDGLAALAETEDAATLGDLTSLEDRVQRLIRERDTIGPVNLRAEAEMEEVAARIESMEAEAEDLVAAIKSFAPPFPA